MKTNSLIITSLTTALLATTSSAHAGLFDTNFSTQKSPALLVSVSEEPAKAAGNFISELAEHGLGIIAKKDAPDKVREAEFRKLLHDNFDMKTIGRFTLGAHWKNASKEQQAEFLKLFEEMIITVYSRRFKDYNGEIFEVKGSRKDGEKDSIVSSEIIPKSGQKIKIDWRVRNKDGKFSVVDIIVEGVSMSITQRSDFSSVIQRGGGKIDVLLSHLRKTEKL